MKRIDFTEHAKRQLLERNISKVQVVKCIRLPGKIVAQEDDRVRYAIRLTKRHRKFVLVVVVEESQHSVSVIVVTAFTTTKISKYI